MSSRETMPPDTPFEVEHRPSTVRLEDGTLVGPYRVMRLIGRGGMGEVWIARDEGLGRRVALKVLHQQASHLSELLVREARTTAHFSHPHIVQIYGTGVCEGGVWLALEFIDGGSLRDRLQTAPLSALEGARLLRGVADALVHAHAKGVVHQDLKPENILLGRDGRARVADFGLAQRIDTRLAQADVETLASVGMGALGPKGPCGTPPYMSPEQFRGTAPAPPGDIWSFGVLLWETLRGDRPFDEPRDTFARLAGRVLALEAAPDVPDVPPALGELISRCLCPDPAGRPTAIEVRTALDQCLQPTQGDGQGPPFRGLSRFTESGAGSFFGREEEVALLAEQLREQPILPLIGPSGTGKSSLVLGGLVPRLREAGPIWLLETRPGRDPFGSLATSLRAGRRRSGVGDTPLLQSDAERVSPAALRANPFLLGQILRTRAARMGRTAVLFVDQLEELLSTPDPEAHHAYLRNLVLAADDPADPVRVILTLRDDFLGRLALDADIRRALSRVCVVRPPGPAGLQRILEAPVEARGFQWESPDMVAALVEATDGVVAALPLLQVAGTLLWERRDLHRRVLPERALTEIGGLRGALAAHADRVVVGLPPDQESAVRRTLLRLVTPGETRAVVDRGELEQAVGEGFEEALARLVAHRLVSVRRAEGDASEVELVHEALISHWGRLRRWLDEVRGDHRLAADLEEAARVWERQGRGEDACLSGLQLEEVVDAKHHRALSLTPLAARFVEASVAAEGARRVRRRRARMGLAALMALLFVALSGAVWERSTRIGVQQELVDSERERLAAVTLERDAATASVLYMQANLGQQEDRTSLALTRALAGLELTNDDSASATHEQLFQTVLTAFDRSLSVRQIPLPTDGNRLRYVTPHPTEPWVAASTAGSGETFIVDLETGATRARTTRCRPTKRGGAWSPDGTRLAHQCEDTYNIEVLDSKGMLLQTLDCDGRSDRDPASRGVVAWKDTELIFGLRGGVCVYDGKTLDFKRFLPLDGPIAGLDVSKRWITAGVAQVEEGVTGVRVWDRSHGEVVLELAGYDSFLRHLQVTDQYLIRRYSGPPEHLEVWSLGDAPTRKLHLSSPRSWQGSFALDEAGGFLVAPWEDRLRRWSMKTWTEDPGFNTESKRRIFPITAPGGKHYVEAGWSGRLRVVEADHGTVLFDEILSENRLRPVTFLPDGRLLAWTSTEGIFLWDFSDIPRTQIPIGAGAKQLHLAGTRAWWLDPDGRLKTATSKEPEPTVVGTHPAASRIRIVASSPDWLLTRADGRLWSWHAGQSGPNWVQPAPKGVLTGEISPDARFVAFRSNDGHLLVLDADGRERLSERIVTPGDVVVDGENHGLVSPALTRVAWSPDSMSLIAEHEQSGERYRCVSETWTCTSMEPLIRQSVSTFSPNGEMLFDRAIDNTDETYRLRRLDPVTGKPMAERIVPALRSSIRAFTASNDEVLAVSARGLFMNVPSTMDSDRIHDLRSEDLGAITLTNNNRHAVISTDGRGRAVWTWDIEAHELLWKAERPESKQWAFRVSRTADGAQQWAVVQERLLLPWSPPQFADRTDLLDAAAQRSNLRVCRGDHTVVPVVPFPADNSPWAPDEACTGTSR